MFDRVHVEITTHCFLRCDFCPSPLISSKHEMPLRLFWRVCAELRRYTPTLALYLLGDPLSVRDLGAYLKIACAHGLKVEITTVGLKLDSLMPFVAHPALRQVNFSLTSFVGNTMRLSLEQYLDSIVGFCDVQQQKNKKLFINLRFWDKENPLLAEIFKHLKGAFVDMFQDRDHRFRLAERVFLCLDSLFEWPSLHMPIKQERGFCLGLKSHIGVLCDGRVVPCCLDHLGAMSLGYIQEQSLGEILSSRRALKIRDGFLKSILSEELCKRCGYIQRFSSKIA